MQSKGVRVYHIEDAACVDPAAGTIRHQPVRQKLEQVDAGWLGDARMIGITAGASTPNNKVGETVLRVCETAGVESELKRAIA